MSNFVGGGCRFCEPSTWAGASGIALAWAGMHPEAAPAANAMATIFGAIAVYLREGGK